MEELVQLKLTYQAQGEDFIQKLTQQSFELLKELDIMREKVSDLDFTVNVKTAKLATHENNITEIFQRLDNSEKNIEELIKARIHLT